MLVLDLEADFDNLLSLLARVHKQIESKATILAIIFYFLARLNSKDE